MDYRYLSEKLSAARYALMLPHSQGEEASISQAFHECVLGFHDLDEEQLDDNERDWVSTIKLLMEALRPLSTDQMIELSSSVDELAHSAHRKFWSE